MPISRKRLTNGQKLAIVNDAAQRQATGEPLKAIARSYGLQTNQIRSWRQKVGQLVQTKKSKKSLCRGAPGRLHAFEEEIVGWILQYREAGVPLAYKHVVLKAIELNPNFDELSEAVQYHTIRRLCIRNCIVVRRVTHTAQVHPQETVDQALQWLQIMRPIVSAPGVDQALVINMDQTPVYMSMHPPVSLNLQGQKTVHGRRTADKGSRFTACLAVSANGDKLKPFLIFKGKVGGRIETREFPQNPHGDVVHLCVQESAWQDERNMLQWIDAVFVPYVQQRAQGIVPVLLVLDHFSVHWTADVRARLETLGITTHKIPPGCTGLVQPIDVGIGKPFKERVKALWWEWMKDQGANAATFVSASREQAIEWIADAWELVTPEIVKASWRKTDYSYFAPGL